MTGNHYDQSVLSALQALGKLHTADELLDYRTAVAGLLDAGLGDIPEVDLVLLAHRHGVARAVAEVRGKKISQKELSRLKEYATKQLFGVSEDAAHFAVRAWAGAFGKAVPPRSQATTPKTTPKVPGAQKKPSRKPAAKSYCWKSLRKRLAVVLCLLALAFVARVTWHFATTSSAVVTNESTPEHPVTSKAVSTVVQRAVPFKEEQVPSIAQTRYEQQPPTPPATGAAALPSQASSTWERYQQRRNEKETRRINVEKHRRENAIPSPPEGYEWRYYPNDPRAKYQHRSNYPYGALPPQRPRNN